MLFAPKFRKQPQKALRNMIKLANYQKNRLTLDGEIGIAVDILSRHSQPACISQPNSIPVISVSGDVQVAPQGQFSAMLSIEEFRNSNLEEYHHVVDSGCESESHVQSCILHTVSSHSSPKLCTKSPMLKVTDIYVPESQHCLPQKEYVQ